MVQNKLLKNSSVLFAGTLVAFALSFVFNAYFRRVLSDEVFATYEVILRVSSILTVVYSARYGVAIVVPKEKEKSKSLFWGANIIALLSCCLTFLVISVFNERIADLVGLSDSSYLYFIPFISLLMTLNQNVNFLYTRLKRFKEQSLFKIFHRVGEGGANYSFMNSISNSLLAIGDLIGRGFIFLYAFVQLKRKEASIFKFDIKVLSIHLKEFKEYPLYNALPALLNTLSAMLPMLLISRYYGVYLTSKIGLSFQVLAIPLALLATSISQVVMQRVSQDRAERKMIGKDIIQVLVLLLVCSVLGVITITFFGPDLFKMIFGDSNTVSGEYSQLLVFSVAIKLIVSPFSGILPALNKIKLGSYWQLLYFCLTLTLCLRFDEDIETFLLHLVGVDIISYLIYGLLIYKEVFKYNKGVKIN